MSMSERRRMLLATLGKKVEPLIVYQSPNSALTNGTIGMTYASFSTSYGSGKKGILCSPRYNSKVGWTSGRFSIANIDATKYSKLIIEYECGTSQSGYTVPFNNMKVGWGYSASGNQVNYTASKKPINYSTSGVAEFDIKSITGNICIGAHSADGDAAGYLYYIKVMNIRLE